MTNDHDKTIMRSLGEFFGHIWSGVKNDPAKKNTQIIEKEVHEEKRGKTTLRETVIREIEVDNDPNNEPRE